MKRTSFTLLFVLFSVSLGFSQVNWLGNSDDWFDANNWDPAGVPDISDNIIIPDAIAIYPEITGAAEANDVLIESGASITLIVGGSLEIAGNLVEDNGFLENEPNTCLITDNSGANDVYLAVAVPNAPTGDANQEFCESATVDDLDATGDNIQWYPSETSTSSLDLSDQLDNLIYYATQTIDGCESTDRLEVDVTINPNAVDAITYTGCEGDGYEEIVNGTTYDESNPTGTEILVGEAANGCDSIILIDFTFLAPAESEITYTGCEGDGHEEVVNGTTYDESNPTGTEILIGEAANGCDSIVSIDLTFLSHVTGVDEVNACGSYEWIDGITYTESNNTATDTLQSASGCDSIVTLNLTITQELDVNVSQVLNSQGSLVLISEQPNATYQWLDCENGLDPISGANNRTFVPQQNGEFALSLSRGACSDTTNCININSLNTEAYSQKEISIYPNPSSDKFNVETVASEGTIEIVDALGRTVKTILINSSLTEINMIGETKGVYIFKIHQSDNVITKRVVLK